MGEPLRKEVNWTLAEFLDWYREQPGRYEVAHHWRLVVHHARGDVERILSAILRSGGLPLEPPGLLLRVQEMLPPASATEEPSVPADQV